jgi:hypothetical protein
VFPNFVIISLLIPNSVSPSVYIAFQSLAATNVCGAVGGNDTAATTLAFANNELSTAPAYALPSPQQALPALELSFTAATWRDAYVNSPT